MVKKLKSSTFKRIKLWLPLVILLLLNMAMMRSVSAEPAQSIWVDPQLTDNLYANDIFTVNMKVNITDPPGPGTTLYGFEYKLTWNESLIDVVSIQYHVPTGWTAPFIVANYTRDLNSVSGRNETHVLSITTLGGPGFTGVTSLCTYSFQVLSDVEAWGNLNIWEEILVDNTAAVIAHTTYNGTYHILEMDSTPPTIYDPSRMPSGDVEPDQDVRVSVDVTDAESGVKNVTLTYTTDDWSSWTDLEMIYDSTSGLYNATIPGQPAWTWVKYNITAYDNAGNNATRDGAGPYFTYQVMDSIPPSIGDPSRMPSGDVEPDQDVKVSVDVTDAESGVKNVTLTYTTDNGTTWTDLEMIYDSTSGLYNATIPGQPADTWVKFKIIAYDNAGNNATRDGMAAQFVYQVVPEFPAALIMPLFIVATLIAVLLGKKVWSKKRRNPSLPTRA